MTVYCEPDPARTYPGSDPVRVTATLLALYDDLAANPGTSLVVLGAGVDQADALGFAAEQRVQRPFLGVVLLRDTFEVDLLAAAIRAGVREVVATADTRGGDAACERARELSARLGVAAPPVPAVSAEARVVTVFAGKGGVGKSTVATNLAATLADGGRRRVLLIDLDLHFGDIGILLPKVRIRDNMRLDAQQYRIKIADMPVAQGEVEPTRMLAIDSGVTTGRVDGVPTKDPAFGTDAIWIDPAAATQAEMYGYTVVEAGAVLATHLTEVCRRHADEILTRDATKHLVDELKKTSRYTVSVIAIQSSNSVLRLVRFLRLRR